MKRLLIIIGVMLCAFAVQAEDFTEDFSTIQKGKYGANGEETVSMPSGQWKALKMEMKENNGAKQFVFSGGTASYLVTPAVADPAKITLNWGSGGNNKLAISYSVDNGAWQQLDEISSGGSGTKTYTAKTGLDGQANVRFRFAGSSTNTYVSKVVIKSATVIPVDPDDPTYITEGVWVPTKPFPAAKNTYYISPDGNDNTGDGSEARPWFNIAVAYAKAQAGDHIVCKGGTYKISKYGSDGKLTVRMNKAATEQAPIVIRCEDGEKPVFDFEQQLLDCNRQTSKVGDRGILLTGDYHIIFGIHIMHAADNGIKLEGNHNRIERCEFSYNLDSGIQLGFGHKFSDTHPGISQNDGTYCCYNDIIDCDSHHNCDCDANYGSDADGFACKMHNGIGNRFIRCRAWRNSDDAWDLYETDYDVVLAECWAWESGNAEDHLWVKDYLNTSASFSGNGNGIKLGGNGEGGSSKGVHYAFNCIAFGCDKSGSVKGFDCNSHKGGHVLVGCLGFDNGYDYMFESGGSNENTFFYNNVCLGRQEIMVGTDNYNAIATPMSKNGWTNHLVTGVSAANYITLDEDDALLPRDIKGGLPRRFGRLNADPENVLTDAGQASLDNVDGVWQKLASDFPFLARTVNGSARDLGPYERPSNTPTAVTTPNALSKGQEGTHRKALIGGRLVIVKDGQHYNALGQALSR
ncbi:MAG: hypothetical protein IJP74_05270 [Prevotella sp.]|nr:hypothetical protein [Prevotella sp.]